MLLESKTVAAKPETVSAVLLYINDVRCHSFENLYIHSFEIGGM